MRLFFLGLFLFGQIFAEDIPEEAEQKPTHAIIGYLTQIKTPSGVVLEIEQDIDGRIIEKSSSDGTYCNTYTYDGSDRLIYMENIVEGIAIERFFDEKGRLIKEIYPNDITIEMEYTEDNHLKKLTLPDKSFIKYSYKKDFVHQVTRYSSDGKYQYYYDYLAETNTNSGAKEHTITESTIFGQKRSRSVSFSGKEYSVQNNLFKEIYNYNENKKLINRQHITKSFLYKSNDKTFFQYDQAGQLKDASVAPNKEQNPEFSLCKDDQLITWKDATCRYDVNGNMCERKDHRGHFYFEYNANNELTEIANGDGSIRYIYDPLGRRIRKDFYEKGKLFYQEYIIYRDLQEIARLDKDGNITFLYVPGSPLPSTIRHPAAIEINQEPYDVIVDGLGNVRALQDKNNKVKARYDYTPFGEKYWHIPYGKGGVKIEKVYNPYQYQCKPFDLETGLLYYGKRYYDPYLARWISPDPYGSAQKENLYQYCNNDPFMNSDPYGEFFMIAIPIFTSAGLISLEALANIVVCGVGAGLIVTGAQKTAEALHESGWMSQDNLAAFLYEITRVDCWNYNLLQGQMKLAMVQEESARAGGREESKTSNSQEKASSSQAAASSQASSQGNKDSEYERRKAFYDNYFLMRSCAMASCWEFSMIDPVYDLPTQNPPAPSYAQVLGQPVVITMPNVLDQPVPSYKPLTLSQPLDPPVIKNPVFDIIDYYDRYTLDRKRKQNVLCPPVYQGPVTGIHKNVEDMLLDGNWVEITRSQAAKAGHRKFMNKEGTVVRSFDYAKPGTSGHRANNHWHEERINTEGVWGRVNMKGEYAELSDAAETHLYPKKN